jgi:DNA-binding NtrC family response regulator
MHALVIDDDPSVRRFVGTALHSDGWTTCEVESAERAFEKLHEREWVLICCDVVLGGVDGYAALRRFKQALPSARVILITGHGSAIGALDAAALGADDYLLKPFSSDALLALAAAAREKWHQQRSRRKSEDGARCAAKSEIEIIGRSQTFIEVMKEVGKIVKTDLPVIITGESGTGKELIARAIHLRSARRERPFVAVNCGAIPSELIEAELFGHTRGAFTGAERERAGLFEEADGGTIFLDEITESTPAFQIKLLRALQDGEIRRIGANRAQRVNVRVIAATNRDIAQEVEANRFRQDLFYRLSAVMVHLPPLRARVADIMPLTHYFARRVRGEDESVSFSEDAVRALESYPWRGNVRELENVVTRAVALGGNLIKADDLPAAVKNYRETFDERAAGFEFASDSSANANSTAKNNRAAPPAWKPLREIEADYAAHVLARVGSKQRAAQILQIDRKTLERLIKWRSSRTPAP